MISIAILVLLSSSVLLLVAGTGFKAINVALNKSVTLINDSDSSLLTDGDNKTCVYFSNSSHELYFDLEKVVQILHFEIAGESKRDLPVLTVRTGTNDDFSDQNFCFETATPGKFSCGDDTTEARYVSIITKGGKAMRLCEIQVLECLDGYFGKDCKKQCHCQSEKSCNKFTGLCKDDVCAAGWKGDNCQQDCSPGSFGSNCLRTCHCIDDQSCDIVIGSCSSGCAPKWYDPACQTALPKITETPKLHDRRPSMLVVGFQMLNSYFNSSVFHLIYKAYISEHFKDVLPNMTEWRLSTSVSHNNSNVQLVTLDNLRWNTDYAVKIVPVLKRLVKGKKELERKDSESFPSSSGSIKTQLRNAKGSKRENKKHVHQQRTSFNDFGGDYGSQNEDNGDSNRGDADVSEDVSKMNNSFEVNANKSGTMDEADNSQAGEEDVPSDSDEMILTDTFNDRIVNRAHYDAVDDGYDNEEDEIIGETHTEIPFFKTSCIPPESPNITSVESWLDEKNDVVISISWIPLTAYQSNCERIVSFIIKYQKFGEINWGEEIADAESSSKNLTGMGIEANSQYMLKVYSQNDVFLRSFSDTWRVRTLSKETIVNSELSGSSGLVSALVVVLVVLIIISIVLIAVMNKRRLKMLKSSRNVPDSAILLKKSGYSVPVQNGSVIIEEDFDVSVLPRKNQNDQNKKSKVKAKPRVVRPAIKLEELESYVKERSENNYEELRKEYKEIPEGNVEATTVAGLKMDNRLKNRFINIIPYDHSRVILDLVEGDSTSDYINANYINGYNKAKFYIAAQGCNKWSVQDIWRMLWQENSLRIVVLTNLVEKGRPKCEQYWPDQLGEEKMYGDLGVTLTTVESSASHVVRSFTVRKCMETGYNEGSHSVTTGSENFGKKNSNNGGSLKKSISKKTSQEKNAQLRENTSDVDLKKAERESLLLKNGDIKENCIMDASKQNGSIKMDGTIYENCKARSSRTSMNGENIYANLGDGIQENKEIWVEETREIKQFHFTSWPDHGVPYHTAPLIAFRNKVRKTDSSHPGPIIVHCSAGVGRSGTFIALDYLLEQAEAEKKVDLHGLTHNMRLNRCNMIQTVEQYIFVYAALIEAMKSKSSVINLSDFEARYAELLASQGDSTKNGLLLQFEQLQKLQSKSAVDSNCDACLPLNVCKNRNSSILPDDNHRPYLMTNVEGTNDYINAIFLDSYRRQNSLILTQMPLLNTVIDLWRMVRDHKCSAIIMLNHYDNSDETAAQYWPEENEECECGPFLIETLSTDREDPDIIARQLQLNYFQDIQLPNKTEKQSSSTATDIPSSDEGLQSEVQEQPSEAHQVIHLQLLNWSPNNVLPPSDLAVIRLIEKVDEIQKKNPEQPVIIHCLDGASQSGLLIASVCVWERMKDELEVDIFETVKRLKALRPHVINSVEQYGFLYKLILLYLREFATYSNFN